MQAAARAWVVKGVRTNGLVYEPSSNSGATALISVITSTTQGPSVANAWSSAPAWHWPVGLVVFVAGSALLIASMVVNPFFEKTVRIQAERGHRVIDTGPYAFVRHPGYVGFLAWIVSAPLLLGSVWAWVPALLGVVGVVVRTALEDRTLRRELTGYDEYARRVPFRLIPGVW